MIRVGSNNKDTPYSNVMTSVVALMAVAIEYVYSDLWRHRQLTVREGRPTWSSVRCQHSEDIEQGMGYVCKHFHSTVPLTRHIGIFAGRQKIPKGSFIGIYAGELLTENEGDARGT